MTQTPVLIVGAGPTGLMMACQLVRFNIPFRIIDKNSGPSEKSRALAVQSRTLEIYDQMDVADRAVFEGHQTNRVNLVVKGKNILQIQFDQIGKEKSPYPFVLTYEQNKNEQLLIDYLAERNIHVEWNTELISITQNENKVISVIENNKSRSEITSFWFIGADGSKSTSRHLLNIPFQGATYENIFYVLDTSLGWNLRYGELIIYWSKNTFTGFLPMKGEKNFRLVGVLPREFADETNISFSDIEKTISNELDLKITFGETKWFSVYKIHHRCVSNFRTHRCFLAGDAAHVHSPVGGQGMNTGIQDAYNLAWKLALVEKGIASKQILDSYNEERLPIAKRLVNTTDRAFEFQISNSKLIKYFRVNIFPIFALLVLGNDSFKKLFYKSLSQISINYRNSRLSQTNYQRIFDLVKAGDRIPFCFVVSEKNVMPVSIFSLLKNPSFHIIIFNRNEINLHLEKVKTLFNSSELFKVIKIEYSQENKDVFRKMNVNKWLICILRPDNHIGFLSDEFNPEKIKNYFNSNGIVI